MAGSGCRAPEKRGAERRAAALLTDLAVLVHKRPGEHEAVREPWRSAASRTLMLRSCSGCRKRPHDGVLDFAVIVTAGASQRSRP